jgi:cleavage stimulation factor subunit 2
MNQIDIVAKQLLTSSPQLAYATFQAMLMMNLVNPSVLQQVVASTGQANQPPAAAPPMYQQPPQAAPPIYQQPPPVAPPPAAYPAPQKVTVRYIQCLL